MDSNPNEIQLAELEASSNPEPAFYVVGIRKFSILFISTLGFYTLYWFYANWKAYKKKHDEDLWPVPRAIFSIFYVHSLFSKVQEKLERQSIKYEWSHSSLATCYVVIAIACNAMDRLSMKEIWSPTSDILSLALLFPLYYIVLLAQKAVNHAEGDTEGSSNHTLTWANYLWVVPGTILWIFAILGLLVVTGVIVTDV